MGYLRMATHSRLFSEPLSPAQAEGNVQALLSLPHVRTISEGDGFWEAYGIATRDRVVRGNDVPDSHLAALLLQHGIRTLYTNDSDFRRFGFLDVKNPLQT